MTQTQTATATTQTTSDTLTDVILYAAMGWRVDAQNPDEHSAWAQETATKLEDSVTRLTDAIHTLAPDSAGQTVATLLRQGIFMAVRDEYGHDAETLLRQIAETRG